MISVIVLTYKREEALGKCLASLESQIERDFETVVVNTAPDPLSAEITEHERNLPVAFHHLPAFRNLADEGREEAALTARFRA